MKTMMKGLMMIGGLTAMVGFVPSGPVHPPKTKQHSATVTVDNTRGVPVTVYLDQDQSNVSLGTVAADTKATLALPPYLLDGDEIGFTVHPTRGEDLGVENLTFQEGKDLRLFVPKSNDGYIPPPPPVKILNPGPGTTTVTVVNPTDQSVTVTLQHGGFDTSLGVAPAGRETTLVVPPAIAFGNPEVQIFLTPNGGLDLDTPTFTLNRDAHLMVTVPEK